MHSWSLSGRLPGYSKSLRFLLTKNPSLAIPSFPLPTRRSLGQERFRKKSSWSFTPEADADIAQAVMQAVAPIPEEPALEKVSAKDARASAQMVAQEIAENAQAPKPEYHFPPINLLKTAPGGATDGTAEMREKYPPPERGSAELQN